MRQWERPRATAAAARFSGRVAIITGSTADPSIGRSCALRLAHEGASVVVNGRDKDRVASTEAAFRAQGFHVLGVVGSMDTEAAVSTLTDRAVEAFGRVDLIVSTVGGAPHPLSFDAISEEQLLETFRLNTWPTVALIRAALGARSRRQRRIRRDHLERLTAQDDLGHGLLRRGQGRPERHDAHDCGRPGGEGVRLNAVSPGLVRTTATRPIWKTEPVPSRFGVPPRPPHRGGRHRGGGLFPAVRRRSADHWDHARCRRRKPPLQRLDADPLERCRRGQGLLQRGNDHGPDLLDLLAYLVRRHARKLLHGG